MYHYFFNLSCDESPMYSSNAPESATWRAMAVNREHCGLIIEADGPFKDAVAKIGRSKVVEYFNGNLLNLIKKQSFKCYRYPYMSSSRNSNLQRSLILFTCH